QPIEPESFDSRPISPRTPATAGMARPLLNAPSAARAFAGDISASLPSVIPPAASAASTASVGLSTLAINRACSRLTSNSALAAAAVRTEADSQLTVDSRAAARQRLHWNRVCSRRLTQNSDISRAISQTV